MKVTLLASSLRGHPHHQFASSYRVADTLAVDAGCLGLVGTPEQQRQVRHLFLTHCHMDHIATLPIFLENVFEPGRDCPRVYGSKATLDVLQQHVFNDLLWPDFVNLSNEHNRFVEFVPLEPGMTIEVDGIKVTPVPMTHVVPTQGYIFTQGDRTLALAGDTGPTQRFWEVVNETANVNTVIIESAFVDRMERLANTAQHLTPSLLKSELAKMTAHPAARILVVHVKAFVRQEMLRELRNLNLPNLEVMEPDCEYEV